MKKKTKTTSETSSNATMTGTNTTTPNAPSWVSDIGASLAGQIPGIKTQVAGASALQQKAMDGVSGIDFGGLFGDAASMAKGGASKFEDFDPSALGGVQSWLNPFLGGVVDATAADLDVNDARTRSMQALGEANSKTFGGSGAALTRAFTEDALERARGTTLGGLRMGAFDSAAANSQQDKTRELNKIVAAASNGQAGASTLAGIGSTGVGLQAGLGQTQRDIENQSLNSGLADLITKMGLFGDLSPIMQLLTGQTTTSSGSTSQVGKASGTSTTSDPIGQISALLTALGSGAQGAATAAGG